MTTVPPVPSPRPAEEIRSPADIGHLVEQLSIQNFRPIRSELYAALSELREHRTEVERLSAELADARAELAEAVRVHRDLTSRLGFGDNVTEPQADNAEIVAWCDEQSNEAAEWRESQSWRSDCAQAGHPDDQDCHEHDPSLRLDTAERALEAVRAVADAIDSGEHATTGRQFGQGMAHASKLFRAALSAASPTTSDESSFCPRDHGCSLPAGHDGDCSLTAALCFCPTCEAKASAASDEPARTPDLMAALRASVEAYREAAKQRRLGPAASGTPETTR